MNSAKIELVFRSALVSTVGLEPSTSPTKGKVRPVTAEVYFIVPSNLGSLSSEYFSCLYSKPTNIATGPAGISNIAGLEALKSNEFNSLVSFL